jgi:DNA polymerase III epsilon subunit-like protein
MEIQFIKGHNSMNNIFRFLTLDTETGGLDHKTHSLLEVCLTFNELYIDQDSNEYKVNQLSDLYIPILEEPLITTKEALSINNIDITTWTGVTLEEASITLDTYLESITKDYKLYKITVLGHNPTFDINFLSRIPSYKNKHCTDYLSHRCLDTSSIGKFLQLACDLSVDISKSNSLFDFFNLSKEYRHTAYGDCINTTQAFVSMLNMIRTNSVE